MERLEPVRAASSGGRMSLCTEAVYRRDTLRRTGRGPSGFEMHYTRGRCSRRATIGQHCWQHDRRCQGVNHYEGDE